MLVFAPSLLFLLHTMFKHLGSKTILVIWFTILNLPPALFVDHGHYQFNQVMHGFVLLGIAFMIRQQLTFAVIAMVLAVNFKQTALYFALPFVIHAISILRIKSKSPNVAIEVDRVLYGVLWLGLVFLLTNLVLWTPWLISRDESGLFLDWDSASQVLQRIFPIRRGIFEDKVASFWCVLHYLTPLKVNTMLERSTQFQMTMGTTLLLCIPASYYLWKAPTTKQFLLSLFCVSMIFFMFGFQVHEK